MADDVTTTDTADDRIVKPVILMLALAIVLILAVAYVVTTSRDEPGDPAFTGPNVPAVPAAEEEVADESAEPQDIVAAAKSAGDFRTLVEALDAAGLTETLEGDGPFTVFAPTDAAFDAALVDLDLTVEDLLDDRDALADLLSHHVVGEQLDSSALADLDGETIETLAGDRLEVTIDGDTVSVDGVDVVTADVAASNGVIHVVGAVLVPDGF